MLSEQKADDYLKLTEITPESVTFIQRKLASLGLLSTPVDGIPGPDTHKAWAAFKRNIKSVNLDKVTASEIATLQKYTELYQNKYTDSILTSSEVKQVFLREPTATQLKDLNQCLIDNEIIKPARIAHFLAQTGHESGGLRWLVELSDGSAYEFRKDLGNTQPGDGRRYRGSAVLQLTGRYNYQKFSEYIGDPRVMEGCDYVAKHYPFSSAGWFWTTRNINKLCDQGASVAAVTKVVNGGSRGLADRLAYYNRARAMLNTQQANLLRQLKLK
jgi:putative chitinase